jgi:hypothetical protein
MDITPPKNDQGVQRLKEANRNGSVKQTDRVSPFPAIESSETHHETDTKPAIERRQGQRRQHQRREEESTRQYDTRSGEERRQGSRRLEDRLVENRDEGQSKTPPHIDEKV